MPPINELQAHQVKLWMTQNFGPQLAKSVQNMPFDVNVICAIAGKEAALYWLSWINSHSAQDVLARCVFDASGDAPNTSRAAFPQNTAAFVAKCGAEFADELIDEANESRSCGICPPARWSTKDMGYFSTICSSS